MKLLVRLPSWLGDLVLAEPAVRALSDRCGDGLSLAAPAHLLPLLEGAFPTARRIPLDGRAGERAAEWRGHEAALLLNGSFRSAWTALRAGIPRRVGWARGGRGLVLTDAVRPPRERGATPLGLGRPGRRPRFLPRPFGASCVELVGLLGVRVADARPRLAVPEEALARARARLTASGLDPESQFVLVNAGARPGSAKGYPPELWGAVLDRIAAEGRALRVGLGVVGGPGEEDAVRATAAAAGARVHVLVEPAVDLPELAALASLAAVFLSADAGPRHVAAAVGTPVVVVAGPTDPRHTADHLERQRLARVTVPCGPCHRERCPLKGADELRCMRGVDPERLAALALGFLS